MKTRRNPTIQKFLSCLPYKTYKTNQTCSRHLLSKYFAYIFKIVYNYDDVDDVDNNYKHNYQYYYYANDNEWTFGNKLTRSL